MSRITVTFHDCVYDSAELPRKDQRTVSRVFFSIAVEGVFRGEYYCDLKQAPGNRAEEAGIEVGRPLFYTGPFNHPEFSKHAAAYLRSLLREETSSGEREKSQKFHKVLEVTFDEEPRNVPTTAQFKPTTFW